MSLLGALLVIFIVNRDGAPEFKMTWCILICLLPVFGALIYLFVELNLGGIGLKARTYVRLKETEGLLFTTERTKEAVAESPADFRGFARYMEPWAFRHTRVQKLCIIHPVRTNSKICWKN